ncbi:MAG: hypothetical protein QM770_10045 [Tepidisphaeraceae bacterium]
MEEKKTKLDYANPKTKPVSKTASTEPVPLGVVLFVAVLCVALIVFILVLLMKMLLPGVVLLD